MFRQENKGAPSARNKGLEFAKGEYVIFWDADVVGRADMLQKMVDKLEVDKITSFVYCNHLLHISNNIYHTTKKMCARAFDIESLKKVNYIHSTSLIRRQDAIKWDENLKRFQDWDLWLTMSEQGKKGVWLDEYLFEIISSGGMSRWLPSCAYKKPWKYLPWFRKEVRNYENAKRIIVEKHHLDQAT
jgi:glycosyltransferase involved in cell wall biosynthesis